MQLDSPGLVAAPGDVEADVELALMDASTGDVEAAVARIEEVMLHAAVSYPNFVSATWQHVVLRSARENSGLIWHRPPEPMSRFPHA